MMETLTINEPGVAREAARSPSSEGRPALRPAPGCQARPHPCPPPGCWGRDGGGGRWTGRRGWDGLFPGGEEPGGAGAWPALWPLQLRKEKQLKRNPGPGQGNAARKGARAGPPESWQKQDL